MDKTAYPLSLSKEIAKLKKSFRTLSYQHADLIIAVDNPAAVFNLRYLDNENFYFIITKPNLTADYRSFFHFQYAPENEHDSAKTGFNNDLPTILEHFEIWVNLLQEYSDVNWEENADFTHAYEKEFYSDFEIIEDDADTAPFDHARQMLLYQLLGNITTQLELEDSNDPEIGLIIIAAENLQNNIQNLTKRNAVKKLARIFATIKKKGLSLLLKILNDGKDEMIKRIATMGVDGIIDILHRINH